MWRSTCSPRGILPASSANLGPTYSACSCTYLRKPVMNWRGVSRLGASGLRLAASDGAMMAFSTGRELQVGHDKEPSQDCVSYDALSRNQPSNSWPFLQRRL